MIIIVSSKIVEGQFSSNHQRSYCADLRIAIADWLRGVTWCALLFADWLIAEGVVEPVDDVKEEERERKCLT
jgi:hypothetical protein